MDPKITSTAFALQNIAEQLDEAFNPDRVRRLGFALLVFPTGKPGTCNYVSNSNREDMIKALRSTADRLELGEDHPRYVTETKH